MDRYSDKEIESVKYLVRQRDLGQYIPNQKHSDYMKRVTRYSDALDEVRQERANKKKSWEVWLEKGRRVTGEVIGWGGKTPSESTHLPAEGNRGGIGLDNQQSKEDVATQARDKVPTRNAPKWVEDEADSMGGFKGFDRNDIMDELMGDIRLRKAWEVWLDKGKKTNRAKKIIRDAVTVPDVMPIEIRHADGTYTRGAPVNNEDIETHHAVKEKPKKYSGLTPKQRKLQESIDSEKDSDNQYYTKAWESWLEKDSLDGKGANDKIKPTNWVRDPDGSNKKEVKVSPKKFLNNSYGKESGKDTRLVDTHSNEEMPITFGDSRHKIGHNPIMGKKEDKRTEEERGMDGYNEIARGDELGIVESKKRKMRRGDPIPKSQLIVTNNKVVNHDGRHRARAAMEEGDKEIPIDIKTRRNQSYARNDIEELIPEADEYHSFGSHLGQREDPSEEKDTRHPMFGRKKSWESWLEKDSIDGKGANDKIKDPKWYDDRLTTDGQSKDVNISPKKFLRAARNASTPTRPEGAKDHLAQTEDSKKLTRRQVNDGTTTGLDDAHSNPEFDNSTDGKNPNERMGKGKDDFNSNYRGDELGTVEGYKRKLRHGRRVDKPSLTLSDGNYSSAEGDISGHDGRHRARAAMEEGLKKIPTRLVAYSGQSADDYGIGERNNERKDLKGLGYEKDMTENRKELPKTGGKDTRHPMFGRKKSWEAWLDKNNAIETSHKDGEKKVEWDGKFSSSTIEDEVKDEDEKSESEEESLEELTDGKLKEIEKLKSDVDKIITDLARNIKDPKQREDIVQRQADQKVKEIVTKTWELFLVNKMPMNQYDKQPQKKPNEKGLKPAPLTETVPIKNPKGSLGKKKVKRLDYEAQKIEGGHPRKIVEIPKEDNINPEVNYKQGGRPESGKQGSKNSGTGRKRFTKIEEGAENRSILYELIEQQRKIDEAKLLASEALPIVPKVEKPKTEEEKAAERAASIRQFDRKKRDPKTGKIIKSWEAWLEKGKSSKISLDDINEDDTFEEKQRKLHDLANYHESMMGETSEFAKLGESMFKMPTSMHKPNPRVLQGDKEPEGDGLKANKLLKAWENWLEKRSRFKPSNSLHQNIHPHNIPIKDDPYYKNVDLSVDYSQSADARDGDDEYDAIRREKIRREPRRKSWEGWLEKHTVYPNWSNPNGKKPDKKVDSTGKKPEPPSTSKGNSEYRIDTKTLLDILDEQGSGDKGRFNIYMTGKDDEEKKKSWEGWLEKMQGAGDARFGNQHLTGLDQKPVNNEEDEANILPEKDEKTDDKEEKQEKTDNKPYKALGEE